jgi:cytoskeletal protein RodZ
MSSFGVRLKKERESRKISLDEIANSTKISRRHLTELEEERFSELPGGVFNRGFVRAYARFLGLNEDELVAEYVAAEAGSKADFVPPIAMETQKLMSAMAVAKEEHESVRRSDPAARVLSAAVALVVVLGVGGFGHKYYQDQKSVGTAKAAENEPSAPSLKTEGLKAGTPSDQPGSVAVQAASKSMASTAPSATASNGVFVELHAKADSWLMVKADGRQPVEMTLAANQTKTFFAEKELVMKFGNAEAVEITKNGKAMAPFAPGTRTQTLTFTPDSKPL